MRSTTIAFIAGTLLVPLDAAARNASRIQECDAPASSGAPRLYVSAARTGQTINAPYPRASRVEVVIENRNPYKFSYRTTFAQGPLAVVIPVGFFSHVPSLSDVLEAFTESTTGQSTRETLAATDTDLTQKIGAFRSRLSALNHDVEAYNSFVTVVGSTAIDCVRVVGMAEALLPRLTRLLNVSALRRDVNSLLSDAEAAVADDPNESNYAALTASRSLSKALSTIEGNAQDFRNLQSRVVEVSGQESPFFDLVSVAKLRTATSTTVEVYRTDLLRQASSEELVASITVDMGTAPLSVSAGIAVSWLNDATVAIQAASDGMGGVEDKFGLSTNSEYRPTGIVMLNGHVRSEPAYTLGPSVGFSVRQRGEETGLEYFVGGSIGLEDDQIWVTIGAHLARVARLSGFSIGDDVPESLKGSIPVEESFKADWMFAITFKIR